MINIQKRINLQKRINTANNGKVILFTNARDELKLKEWVAHHLLLGFDFIYIFDHKSQIPLKGTFQNFNKNSQKVYISRCELETNVKDTLIAEAASIAKNLNYEWFLYLDADEFLVINDDAIDSVQKLLSCYKFADSVSCNWLLFGTNFHVKEPKGLIIENYTRSETNLNDHIKTFIRSSQFKAPNAHRSDIINPDKAYHVNGIQLNKVFPVFNENKHYINPINYRNSKVFVAHYIVQSEETYINRKVRLPRDDWGTFREQNIILYGREPLSETHTIHSEFNDNENMLVKNKYSKKINDYLISIGETKELVKPIIIYTHMPQFDFKDGGTVVQYLLAKTLDEMGYTVRIYSSSGIKVENSLFSKYYENDFPIDDNVVVIYCEGTQGNPLNARYVIRWMLSKLGQNVPHYFVNGWGKNELVYYICSEEKIAKNPEKIGNLYKFLQVIYINPCAKNNNLTHREGVCYTIRKAEFIHGKIPDMIHPPDAFEIKRDHTQLDCIKIFNEHKYFISYDSITFLSYISTLCGCISIVKKVDGLSKQDWIHTIGVAVVEYLKESGEQALYGVAYGLDDLKFATDTLHMAPNQWSRIIEFSKKKYVSQLVRDIIHWDENINTIQNNFFE